ncbi:MAG: DUF4349 domain-containing protein [Acholeplasmataceae bacterium]
MKRIVVFFLAVLMIGLAVMGCSSDYSGPPREDDQVSEGVDVELDHSLSTPTRKIIYEVDATYYVDDIDRALTWLKDLMEEDEWIDREERSDTSAHLTMRIKSERLDAFVEAIENEYESHSYRKVGEDISLEYQDKSDLIARYNDEMDRNLELIEEASLSEILIINERVSELEQLIATLEGELNLFDSLVDYSEVRISIHKEDVYTRLPFGERINEGFANGVSFVVSFFDGLVIVLVTLFPVAVVFVPVGYGGYRIARRIRMKKQKKDDHDRV